MAGYSQAELTALIKDLTGLEGQAKYNISEVIFLNSFKERDVKDDFVMINEVTNDERQPVFLRQDDWSSFETLDQGSCKLPTCEIADEWSEFRWKVGKIGCELVICMESFTTDFNRFFNTWVKNNEDDVNSAIVQFIAERFQSKHVKAEARVYFFADSTVTNKLINSTDGVFSQAIARATANAELRVEITQNQGATAEQQMLTGEQVYNYLAEAYNKMSITEDFDPSNSSFLVDRQNANALVGWLNSLADLKGVSCDCIDPEKVTKSRVFTWDNTTLFGIPLKVYNFQAMMKGAGDPYYDVATGLYIHRNVFLLVRNENILLGYELEETLSSFKIIYDEREEEVVIKGRSKLAPGLPTDAFIVGY